jgi:hypothetical protein
MGLDPVRSFVRCALASGVDEVSTTILLSTGQGSLLPDPAVEGSFNLTLYNYTAYKDPAADPSMEIVRCTSISGDMLTIVRAQEGTAAKAHNSGVSYYAVRMSFSKAALDGLRGLNQQAYRSAGSTKGLFLVGTDDSQSSINLDTLGYFTQDLYWAVPTVELAGRQVDQVSLYVANSGTFNAKMAVYYDTGGLYPGALFADLGAAVFGASGGLQSFTASPLPLTFPTTRIYWYVVKFDRTVTNRLYYITPDRHILGWYDNAAFNNLATVVNGWQVGSAYANAAPNPFTAGGTLLTTVNTRVPAIFRRYSIV